MLLSVAGSALAHHSRAPFLLDETMQVEGVVTEVNWGNPHLYLEVSVLNDLGGEHLWTFEGHSVPGLVRNGWARDSVEVGDDVVVVANPNSDPETRFALLDSVTTPDGSTFYSFRRPDGQGQAPARIEPSTDFSGTWRVVRALREALVGPGFDAPTDWPVTERGQALLDEYDAADNPGFDCIPASSPGIIFAAYGFLWSRTDERIVVTKEHSTQVRVLHLDGAPRPEDYRRNSLGYSVGHIDHDGVLVVETTNYSPTRWGNIRGIDSSEEKRVTERYELTNDGLNMDVSYTIEDPVYLTEPKTVARQYRKVADYDFAEEPPCDTATSRRHLAFE